jgi:HlyD family secretion protein/epimerase transport system membrane fusion protein
LADAKNPEINKLIDGQSRIFRARNKTLLGSIGILNQQISQLKEKLTGIRAQKRAKQKQLKLVGEELDAVNKLFDKHYIDRPRILRLKRENAELNGELGDFISELAETAEAISEKKQEILQRNNDFEQAVVD